MASYAAASPVKRFVSLDHSDDRNGKIAGEDLSPHSALGQGRLADTLEPHESVVFQIGSLIGSHIYRASDASYSTPGTKS